VYETACRRRNTGRFIHVSLPIIVKKTDNHMTDENNELIDKNLTIICEYKSKNFLITKFIDSSGEEIGLFSSAKLFAEKMENLGLISMNVDFASVLDSGYEIYKNGGWIKHIENRKIEIENEAGKAFKRDSIEIANLEYSIEVNKWLLKTKWWPHFISIISLIASVFFGIYSIKYKSKTSELLERIEIIELKLKELPNDARPLLLNPKESAVEATTEKNENNDRNFSY
jgi:hypothetical protein